MFRLYKSGKSGLDGEELRCGIDRLESQLDPQVGSLIRVWKQWKCHDFITDFDTKDDSKTISPSWSVSANGEYKPLSSEQIKVLKIAIDQISANFPELGAKLNYKLNAGQILFNTTLTSGDDGEVDRSFPQYIQLNENNFPADISKPAFGDLKRILAHEYVYTVQFGNIASIFYWGVLDGGSLVLYTPAEQFGKWLGGLGWNYSDAYHENKPSERMADILSKPVQYSK